MRLKIQLSVTVDGDESIKGEIDGDHYCCLDLMRAIRNGKDPVAALSFLAEVGSKALSGAQFDKEAFAISVSNLLGEL